MTTINEHIKNLKALQLKFTGVTFEQITSEGMKGIDPTLKISDRNEVFDYDGAVLLFNDANDYKLQFELGKNEPSVGCLTQFEDNKVNIFFYDGDVHVSSGHYQWEYFASEVFDEDGNMLLDFDAMIKHCFENRDLEYEAQCESY